MSKTIKNILCYSHYDFDNIMRKNNWIDFPGKGISCISICSPNEGDLSEHWFKYDVNTFKVHGKHVFNLDIDDCGPYWFGSSENFCYDKSLELYLNKKIQKSNNYFNHENLHVLNYDEAFRLVNWIDFEITHNHTFYIHCAVGVSRSQGVVRYILDTYGNEFDIRTNPDNPCIMPNAHVVMMLKRAYRQLFYNDIY